MNITPYRSGIRIWIVAGVLASATLPVLAEATKGCEKHAAHRMAQQRASYTRAVGSYDIPDMTLLNQNGETVDLATMLDSDQPVGLTFIFTTCTTICPVMTATFRKMQRELAEEVDGLRLVAISIDPEFDKPSVLKAYSERYQFGDGWSFLTGESEQVTKVLKAFDAHYGDKMNHRPLYLFKRPDDESWLRIEGLARGADMVAEYRALMHGP